MVTLSTFSSKEVGSSPLMTTSFCNKNVPLWFSKAVKLPEAYEERSRTGSDSQEYSMDNWPSVFSLLNDDMATKPT